MKRIINYIKTMIIVWAFNDMVEKFITNDDGELIEVHLKTGFIIYTVQDTVKSIVEQVIDDNRLKDKE
jgi:hypothetical protein